MNHFVKGLALVCAVGASLLVALAGAWRDLPIVTLGVRCLVAAVLVFGFVRAGAELAGKAVLRDLAEDELDQAGPEADHQAEEQPSEDRQKAA
jgi:hypothetical protein